jgi:hypothetical protein
MIYERNLSREHEEVFGLFPWYLNGTIAETERQKVDEHVRVCAACRDQRLEALSPQETAAPEPSVGQSASRHGIPRRRAPMPWPRLAAASIAVLAVGLLSLVSADRWMQIRALPSEYRTVTTPAPRAPDEVIRAVFSPAITLVELQAILDEAQLRIISGPTEAGVYSLAANSDRPVTVSLSLLRRHASVRFAESTRVDPRTPGEPR